MAAYTSERRSRGDRRAVPASTYYATHREQKREYQRRYRQENPHKVAEGRRRYYEANRTKVLAYQRRYNEENPLKGQLRRATRRAQQCGAVVIPFTVDDMLRNWEERDLYGCAFCGGPYEEIEHVMPLSRGGEHSLANIVPSCIKCNRGVGGKHARDPYEWLAERFPELAPILLPADED
jgi:5-methylcytosine-specific restriction endonuclease McrA